ncbi:DNA topoisomerase 1B [Croceitalea dokdonensis DOKDO 023]|uniref:DNA topoisomerase n=1 Tax=Croceitalea dokdonensis DOKDO 023 TaxID=1300341 RepID=A0A0N8H418_9FLAO|nr:DNA topoisomerase IB [Croceitalea dokdonensis]KPM32132.1 DNA topoisomerase 1B [Croceitalea dokdonensis DOKDO 023]
MSPSKLHRLLRQPESTISHLDLVYVTDDKMTIHRIHQEGSFEYRFRQVPLQDQNELERIKGLAIPPAWQDVKITHLTNGHLQAVGRDAKKRKQYRYHILWTKVRKQTKFYRMAHFGNVLPIIRNQVDKDLKRPSWCKEKVLALVLRLMEETHIRIGNEQYAHRNQTYGLTTLRKRHVDTIKQGLKINFTGKRGKKHSITLRNKKLIRLVNQCEEIPGWELFHYYDDKGDKHEIDSTMVNDYIKQSSGEEFTAKDFRTWAGGILFFNSLMEMEPAQEDRARKKNILLAYDATAKALGNTRNVCRKSYVHPLLPMAYENRELQHYFAKAQQPSIDTANFSPSEHAVLELISNYEPELKTIDHEH